MDLLAQVEKLKHEREAVIMAHYYQPPEIQDVADFVGDSLQLAQEAARTGAPVVVVCGVRFMGESAKILNPDRTVLIPDPDAGCPMADMVTAQALINLKKEHPNAVVVSYVNSSAEVKAVSDICCTSSNALAVVRSIEEERPIIFCPDQNLGSYIMRETGRKMILWPGYCPVHHAVTAEDVEAARKAHPGAEVLVHPECPPEVTLLADVVASTAGILAHARMSSRREFIIGTEEGLLHQLRKQNPGKSFHLVRGRFTCPDMKTTTLESLCYCLETMSPRIEVPEDIRQKAAAALERMLKIK